MRKGETYIILYAAGICLVGSLLLAFTAASLKPRQDAELELDRQFNVLKAFQIPVIDPVTRKRIPKPAVQNLYAAAVRERIIDPETGIVFSGKTSKDFKPEDIEARRVLALYEWVEDGAVTKVAIPICGKGLWSTIYGYLALDAPASRIIGITFYRHGETPGLGGEIEQPWFQANFRGREIRGAGGVLKRIEIAKGKASGSAPADRVVVDGISGSTLTGKGVTEFLNRDLRRYEPYFSKARGG